MTPNWICTATELPSAHIPAREAKWATGETNVEQCSTVMYCEFIAEQGSQMKYCEPSAEQCSTVKKCSVTLLQYSEEQGSIEQYSLAQC